MTDPKQSTDKRTPSDRPTEIRVKELRFSRPNGLEIPVPGAHGGLTSMVNSVTVGKNDITSILYLPWLRHHRVTYSNERNGQRKTFHLHESMCIWEGEE